MIVLILFGIPVALYGAVWLASWERAQAAADGAPARAQALAAGWLLPAALLLHGASLAWPWDRGGVHFGFAKALSATLWIGLVLVWIEGRKVPLEALRLLVLPIAIVAALLPLAFPGADFSELSHRPLFMPHLLAGTLAYGVLLLAALHALLMLWVQRDLHRPAAGGGGGGGGALSTLISRLPPLMVLERVLFRFIAVGFVLLLATTGSGMLFSEEVFGRPFRFEHKTVFSLVSLAFFGVLLAGRAIRGWRGRIATRFTLGGFAVLLLAYVGTRFVLEVVLRRV
ncbi:MAG TPA: cytochrome c biogenesis protein CcsA [Burkholderiaceae bacterium]|nr:cytochrome c biogenesis protein CcsA [Burkholderiaceae bacterium]